MLFHLTRRRLLTELAAQAPVGAIDERRMHVADELLGNGAGAAALAEDVVPERTRDADDVNAIVLIEAVVLDGDECLRQVLWERLDRDAGANLLPDLPDQ